MKKLEAQAEGASPDQSQASIETETESSAGASTWQLPPTSQPPVALAASNDTVQLSDLQRLTYHEDHLDSNDPFGALDPNFVTAMPEDWNSLLPSLPGSPFMTSDPSSDSNSQAVSLTTFSSPGSSKTSDTSYTFPDEAHLNVLELNLMRGAMAIARRLNMSHLIWSLTSTSPFSDPSLALTRFDHLPQNLRPTVAQMTQPHHPVIDLLPWPKVRDKLIMMFSQPIEQRPPSAASPSALVELVYDIEDSAEGVRIWGDDPYSDQSWEVGEKVFSNWWWAFDTDVIRRSNEMRRSRGARLLGEGSILGEVA